MAGKAFESEREILYQVLFDMRRDVTELKKLVHNLMAERGNVPLANQGNTLSYYSPALDVSGDMAEPMQSITPQVPAATHVSAAPHIASPVNVTPVETQDAEEYVEENLSLDEVEKEMIRKALERHHGKRRDAANDLKISERTLYRKIKE